MIIEIQSEIKKRNITRLCHFVHTNKLLHILSSEEGIKAVDFIDEDILVQNDTDRYDGKTDYVNCSIQYPNYWYYKRVKDNNHIFPDWAIIFIDPIVATLETTQFCLVNAAKRHGAYIKKGYEGFLGIFAHNVDGFSRNENMFSNIPTNDQAEVLVYSNIPRKFITGVAFKDESIAQQKIAEWKTLEIPNIDVYVAPELFERVMSEKIHRGMVPSEKRYEEI